jgi:hypothetical protein
MRWKDPLALTTILFAETIHDMGTEIGDREREGLLQGVRFLCSATMFTTATA